MPEAKERGRSGGFMFGRCPVCADNRNRPTAPSVRKVYLTLMFSPSPPLDHSRRKLVLASLFGGGVLLPHLLLADDVAQQRPESTLQAEPAPGRRDRPVVTCVAMQPGGDLVAVGGDDHLLRIWSIRSGELLHTLPGHRDWIRAVLFVPGTNQIVTAGNDRLLLRWTITPERIAHQQIAQHDQAIASLAISPDGRRLAAAGFEPRMCLYDVETGEHLTRLVCPCRDMRAVCFSPDGRLLAAAGRNGRIRLWHVDQWKHARDIDAHRQRVRALDFSPEGGALLSAGEDRMARIWNVATGEMDVQLPTGTAKILTAAYLDANHVATGGSDNAIGIWDLRSRRQVNLLVGHTGSIAALGHDDRRLVSGSFDTTVRLWRPLGNVNEADRRIGSTQRLK